MYERARQAAAAKASPSNTRRPGLPSQRRPWSGEEERALMAGLDQVRGPHWSQILALYGTKGTISEVLKDRNQVQLKDKARNLKLFFLKSGIEVPYYLKTVTGELKTRAPSQAAKREAEERARHADREDQIQLERSMDMSVDLFDNHDTMSSTALINNSSSCQNITGTSEIFFSDFPSDISKVPEDEQLSVGIDVVSTPIISEDL